MMLADVTVLADVKFMKVVLPTSLRKCLAEVVHGPLFNSSLPWSSPPYEVLSPLQSSYEVFLQNESSYEVLSPSKSSYEVLSPVRKSPSEVARDRAIGKSTTISLGAAGGRLRPRQLGAREAFPSTLS